MIPLLNRDVPVVIGTKGHRANEVERRTGLTKLKVHREAGGPLVHMRGRERESVQRATTMIKDIVRGQVAVIGDVASTMRIAAERHGELMGKKGRRIQELSTKHEVYLEVSEDKLTIEGRQENVNQVREALREFDEDRKERERREKRRTMIEKESEWR